MGSPKCPVELHEQICFASFRDLYCHKSFFNNLVYIVSYICSSLCQILADSLINIKNKNYVFYPRHHYVVFLFICTAENRLMSKIPIKKNKYMTCTKLSS